MIVPKNGINLNIKIIDFDKFGKIDSKNSIYLPT